MSNGIKCFYLSIRPELQSFIWQDKSSLYWFGIAVCHIVKPYNWPKSKSRSRFYQYYWWTIWFLNSQFTRSKIQENLDKVTLNKLNENQTTEGEKARLLSLSPSQSIAWLSAAHTPTLGLQLLPNEFSAAVKYRLCASMYEKERMCPCCKTGSLDTLGVHDVSLNGWGDMIARHNRLWDKTISACSANNLSPIREQKNVKPEANSRPGDVYLPCWSTGQPVALDVTLTSPLQHTINSNASRKSGFDLESRGVHIAFERFGKLSDVVRKAMRRIAALTDIRDLYSTGLSVAFSGLT